MKKNIAGLILLVLAIIWAFPVVIIFATAFRSESNILIGNNIFLPEVWTLENFKNILFENSQTPIIRWFINSFVVSTGTTLVVLFVSSLSAFAFARLKFKGRELLFWILMGAIMIPGIMNLSSNYKIITTLGWLNNPLAMIIPAGSGVFSIFLIRQFMLGIPSEIDEAAKIDGANTFQIFWKIILPLSRPVLVVVGLFTFSASWNDFLWPMIVNTEMQNLTLTAGLRQAQTSLFTQYGKIAATAAISAIPVIIIFFCVRRHLLKGVAISSGVKG